MTHPAPTFTELPEHALKTVWIGPQHAPRPHHWELSEAGRLRLVPGMAVEEKKMWEAFVADQEAIMRRDHPERFPIVTEAEEVIADAQRAP